MEWFNLTMLFNVLFQNNDYKMDSENILEARELTKVFKSGDHSLTVLNNLSFSVERGISCAIVGPSGSGKTTLLGLCAGLDNPSGGSVSLNNTEISSLSESELTSIRNSEIGFVFQSFQLISTLTALENVMVPVELRGVPFKKVKTKALELLNNVGLKDRTHHYPNQLSGGEQQRVGLARAFIHEPSILFADEPTGNLDDETSASIEELLFDLNKKQGTTLIIVTHDMKLAQKCDRIIRLKSGSVFSDEYTSGIKADKMSVVS